MPLDLRAGCRLCTVQFTSVNVSHCVYLPNWLMNICFSNHSKIQLQRNCSYVAALCLERYGLLTQAANVPEFSSRCSWFEPWYFKLEGSKHTRYSSSGFLRVFRRLGWIDLLWRALFSSSFPSSLWGSNTKFCIWSLY